MKAIDDKTERKEDKKYALISCEYFPRCYNHNIAESYLCPSRKQICSTWKFEGAIKK